MVIRSKKAPKANVPAKKAPVKAARRVKEVVEEVVAASSNVLLTYVAQITGKKVSATETAYTVDGTEILKAQVVAVIGKTIYYRATVNLGGVADVQVIKGQTCITTDSDDKVVVFDPTAIQIVAGLAASASSDEEDEEGDDEEDDDEDDEPAPKAKRGKKVVEEEEEDDEEEEEEDDEDEEEGDDEEDDEPAPKSKKKASKKSSDDDEDDFEF